ncbi:hypothetical protein O3G_MSEX013528 [Manduca sexta]|uniref:Uncharacterized protein n=1 Tax=Manduca sexta TaxID=7130 RepID=A0A921ZRY7_MANSE|nr:hypothetical protein O3G_MSEX013528 [Manduca sexta]
MVPTSASTSHYGHQSGYQSYNTTPAGTSTESRVSQLLNMYLTPPTASRANANTAACQLSVLVQSAVVARCGDLATSQQRCYRSLPRHTQIPCQEERWLLPRRRKERMVSPGIKLYHTRGRYRRVLLLLSYVNFAYGTDEYRHGVEVDTKNLKYLFAEMDFQVLTYINLTLKTNETLKSLSSVLVGAEVVFTVVSSHGYEKKLNANTSIRCSDGLLTTDGNIIEFFNHKNMPQLLGVPKVFIFQVCRGVVEDYVTVNATANVNVRALSAPRPQRVAVDTATVPPGAATSSPTTPISPPVDLRPLYSDTLVVHSTVPGFVSHRDKFDGSWYIQVLCEVFAESAHDCHVEKLFKLVDERLQQKYGIQTSSVDSRGFNKKLYLHPGLYE